MVIAALKLGLIIVNVNPMYSTREIVHQFNDANVKTVVVLDQFYETVKNAAPETNIKNIIDILIANNISFSEINTSEGDLEDVFLKVIKDR